MSLSTREAAERAASMAQPDVIVPNQNRSAGGMGHSVGVNLSWRTAQAKKQFEADQQADPGVSEVAESYFQEHQRRVAEQKEREAAEEEEKRIYWARIREIERKTLNKKLMAIMWEQEGASDAEKDRVMTLVRQNNPELVDNVDVVRLRLQLLRSVIG